MKEVANAVYLDLLEFLRHLKVPGVLRLHKSLAVKYDSPDIFNQLLSAIAFVSYCEHPISFSNSANSLCGSLILSMKFMTNFIASLRLFLIYWRAKTCGWVALTFKTWNKYVITWIKKRHLLHLFMKILFTGPQEEVVRNPTKIIVYQHRCGWIDWSH